MRQPISRRGFVLGAGAAAILTTRRGLSLPAADSRVNIDLAKETGTIRPELQYTGTGDRASVTISVCRKWRAG